MTERLYLHDAYTSSFVARIVERVLLSDGRLAVALDRDGEILHMLSEEIWEDQVEARIDWPRQPSLAQSAPVHADEARVEAAIAKAIKVLRA